MSNRHTPLPLPPVALHARLPLVYVVNSDAEFLQVVADLLADSQVTVALEQMRPDITLTLANLRRASPSLLILDVIPFRSDAERLLAAIEADADLRRTPTIVASTNPRIAQQVAAAHPQLVRAILLKPFGLDEFYETLSRYVAGIQKP
jgi:CheY-like chemotaxis protein